MSLNYKDRKKERTAAKKPALNYDFAFWDEWRMDGGSQPLCQWILKWVCMYVPSLFEMSCGTSLISAAMSASSPSPPSSLLPSSCCMSSEPVCKCVHVSVYVSVCKVYVRICAHVGILAFKQLARIHVYKHPNIYTPIHFPPTQHTKKGTHHRRFGCRCMALGRRMCPSTQRAS